MGDDDAVPEAAMPSAPPPLESEKGQDQQQASALSPKQSEEPDQQQPPPSPSPSPSSPQEQSNEQQVQAPKQPEQVPAPAPAPVPAPTLVKDQEQETQKEKEPEESEFAKHVCIDGNVLATSSRLDLQQFDQLLLHLVDAVAKASGLRAKFRSVRHGLMVNRSISTAQAISMILTTLHIFPQVKTYFETTFIAVLQGHTIPSQLPIFEELKTGTNATAYQTSDSESESQSEAESEPETASSRAKTATKASSKSAKAPSTAGASALSAKASRASKAASAAASNGSSKTAPSATALALLERFASPEHHKNMKQTTLKFDPMLKSKPITQAVKKPSRAAAAAAAAVVVATTTASTTSPSTSPTPSPLRHNPPSVIRKRPLQSHLQDPEDQEVVVAANGHKVPRHSLSSSVTQQRRATTNKPALAPASSSVPSRWEDLYYKPVPIVNVSRDLDAQERIDELRMAGNPFIIEGHDREWMEFARDWVHSDGSVNTSALLDNGLADCKVPVLEKNYEAYNPIKTQMSLGNFVRKYWNKQSSELYLHQWQFPLHPKAGQVLCYKCKELPQLGDNLLNYWLDAVRGDNPMQYLFMGQPTTVSRMHQDAGGLDIMIAPIAGSKRVRMLHRSATKLDSIHEEVQFHEIDLHKTPMLAFIPAWKTVIKPGQILYMPEGTWHACENVTPCLSYHRFHVDQVNLPGFMASFLAQDAPVINHAEILWNAAQDAMNALDENYHSTTRTPEMDKDSVRKRDCLRALRHVTRALSLEVALPTENSWEWDKLMDDIDSLLMKVDSKASFFAKTQRPVRNVRNVRNARKAVQVVDDDEDENQEDDEEELEGKPQAVEDDDDDDDAEEEDDDDDEVRILDEDEVRRSRSRHQQRGKSQDRHVHAEHHGGKIKSQAAMDDHWDRLDLHVGDIIGVQVFEKRNKAKIREIRLNIELVQVHYVDWGSIYDEFLPVSCIYHRPQPKKGGRGQSKRSTSFKTPPKVHEQVLAKWGSTGALYNAIVLKVLRTNACHVHYIKFEKDWDQWILPGHIFAKYDK